MTDMKTYYSAYIVPELTRQHILDIFPAKFDKVVAHHVTYDFDVAEEQKPPECTDAYIVGCHANDRIQALVIELDGQRFQQTENEKRYLHLTLSRDTKQNVRSVESNDLLETIVAKSGEVALYNLTNPVKITVEAAVLSRCVKTPDSLKNTQKPHL